MGEDYNLTKIYANCVLSDSKTKTSYKTLTNIYESLYKQETPLDYEHRIYKNIIAAKIPGLNPGTNPGAGYSSVGSGDIQAEYKKTPFNIEIKHTADTQMGGTSLTYDYASKKFTPVGKIDEEDLNLILKVAKNKIKSIDNYIETAQKIPPVKFHKNIQGIPLKISKSGRDFLKKQGLLAAINTSVETTTDFIIKHYNKKQVYYIQIGGKGLFYLGENPLNLPIPELEGKIQIEIRLGFSGGGSPFPTTPPIPARSANLRAQARLITKTSSPYTLDDAKSIQKLFSAISK